MSEERKPVKRIRYLEYLRVLSMIFVVLCHVTVFAVNYFPKDAFLTREGWLYYSIRDIAYFSVPVFFT